MTGRHLRCGGRAALAFALSGLVLSACASPSDALGHQACLQVAVSLRTYAKAGHLSGAARSRLVNEANVELREALPKAGLAASNDTDWQALAATLSESSRVPEGYLVQALNAQCKQTLS